MQESLIQSLISLLFDLSPLFFVGIFLLIVVLMYGLRNEVKRTKLIVTIASLLLFYYLFLMLYNIVGIPRISEIMRVKDFNENIFNPQIYLIPFGEGISLSFIFNIVLFIPIGFLFAVISPIFRNVKYLTFLVFSMSLLIEISQLFTLYRATDINDVITNSLGGFLGINIYLLLERFSWIQDITPRLSKDNKILSFLPIWIFILAFINVFIT